MILESGADVPRPKPNVVQALAPDRSDQPFGKAILLGVRLVQLAYLGSRH